MSKERKTINLLPKDDLDQNVLGRFLKWALNFGRYIVIFTELIVIIGFISRFKLDQDLSSLHEQIQENQSIITGFEKTEKEIRFTQKRLAFIKKNADTSNKYSKVLEELSKITPVDVFFTELNIDNEKISVKGNGLSQVGLSTFLNGLKESELFSQIDLSSLSNKGKEDPTLVFELSAQLVNKSEKKQNGL